MSLIGRSREGAGVRQVGEQVAEANGFTSTVLRSLNNGLSRTTELNPRAAFDAGASGLTLARRLGQSGWIHAFVGNLGFVSLRTGEWDSGIAELEGVLADTTDALDRILLVNNLANLHAVRGLPFEADLAEMRATVELAPADTNKVFLLETEGWISLAAGRLEDARDRWAAMVELDPSSAAATHAWLARLALWLGDVDVASERLERYWAAIAHADVVFVIRQELQAGIAALRGDRSAALNGFRDAIEGFRAFRLPIDEAFVAIDMAHVLGMNEPATVDAVNTARATFNGLRSAPLLALVEAAAASGGPLRPGSGAASPAETSQRAMRVAE
jgi:hypothetical protein